ncbi:unnamed protein product [Ceutorhynchus assimilis]|uniref:Uncharacterized protein n=1 Tax=Ceutorhynchus assimilis TaxID=467358 RepID=A0A9N9MR97_9CUCU|nr:unnamed protein product [Ceutorhynchus assimilis]
MSDKHLSSGSVEPPRIQGLLRVYSMKLCPFAERARLVLRAKNLPHDIVNINLQNKPDWYLKINPKGQVPTLLDGDKIITESLDIADYLDEKYPTNTPLYPTNPDAKKHDQQIIRDLSPGPISLLAQIQYGVRKCTPQEALEILLPATQPLEDELAQRGTTFYGGDKPGMVDYMLWPWAERVPALGPLLGADRLPLTAEQIPCLKKWAKIMLTVPTIKELYIPPSILVEAAQARKTGTLSYAKLFNE